MLDDLPRFFRSDINVSVVAKFLTKVLLFVI